MDKNAINEIIPFKFEKTDILSLNIDPYLAKLTAISSSREKSIKSFHRIVFHVSGYDLDPRHLGVIPEVVKFFHALHTRWPYVMVYTFPQVEYFNWWMSIIYFPVIGREDGGGVNYAQADPEKVKFAMEEYFQHANTLAAKHSFNESLYRKRQYQMIQALEGWLKVKAR